MSEGDVYEEVADMYLREDPTGGPKSPAFLKVLSLQFTPKEARLAVQVGLGGGKLDELSERTGIEKGKLEKALRAMAHKGTIWIDPGQEDPTYRVIGAGAPGIIETGLWGNIREPYTVELGKAMRQYHWDWASEKLVPLGMPIAPIWAAPAALPDDALPSENIAEIIRERGYWSVAFCPCRLAHWLDTPGDHCGHLLETCIQTGDTGRWAVEYGMAHELTYDQCVERIRRCNEDGLVTSVDIQGSICNCCNDCCALFRPLHKLGARLFIPSPFVAEVDEETCKACKTCVERCPVGAIEVDEAAAVDQEKCLGCGVCAVGCKAGAMRLVRRPQAVQASP